MINKRKLTKNNFVTIVGSTQIELDSNKEVPYNITRSTGAKNVYIPCPFAGSYAPTWIINGAYYEASSLPDGMISASYGLIITCVREEMNGMKFQCSVPNINGIEIMESGIGILTVVNDSSIAPGIAII